MMRTRIVLTVTYCLLCPLRLSSRICGVTISIHQPWLWLLREYYNSVQEDMSNLSQIEFESMLLGSRAMDDEDTDARATEKTNTKDKVID